MSAPPDPIVQRTIDLIYPQWSQLGEWPTVQWVNLMMRRSGLTGLTLDIAQIARSPEGQGCFDNGFSLSVQTPLQLSIEGLGHSAGARQGELPLFVRLVQILCEKHAAFTPNPTTHANLQVSRRDLEIALAPNGGFSPSDADWRKVGELLMRDFRISSGGRLPSGDVVDFMLVVSDDIERYSGVATFDDYLAAKDRRSWITGMLPRFEAAPRASPEPTAAGTDLSSTAGDSGHVGPTADDRPRHIFIVHGRKHQILRDVELWIRQAVDAKPVILMDQANQGQTLVEKLEANLGSSDFVVVLLTADDWGYEAETTETRGGPTRDLDRALHKRARQNVILELGYAFGRIGRRHVAVVYEEDVQRPSDIDGICYISARQWRDGLARELAASGFRVSPGI